MRGTCVYHYHICTRLHVFAVQANGYRAVLQTHMCFSTFHYAYFLAISDDACLFANDAFVDLGHEQNKGCPTRMRSSRGALFSVTMSQDTISIISYSVTYSVSYNKTRTKSFYNQDGF